MPTPIGQRPTMPALPFPANDANPLTLEIFRDAITAAPQSWFDYLKSVVTFSSETENLFHNQITENQTLEFENARLIADKARLLQKIEDLFFAAKSTSKRSATHPDPEKYDGTRNKFRPFLAQMRLKVKINADYYIDKEAKAAYAVSRLTGTALKQILPLIKEDSAGFKSFTEFEKFLNNNFDDPDPKGTAQIALRSLRQKNRDFPTYLAEFNRYAPDTDYNKEALRSSLEAGISDKLKHIIIHQDRPASFEALKKSL